MFDFLNNTVIGSLLLNDNNGIDDDNDDNGDDVIDAVAVDLAIILTLFIELLLLK